MCTLEIPLGEPGPKQILRPHTADQDKRILLCDVLYMCM